VHKFFVLLLVSGFACAETFVVPPYTGQGTALVGFDLKMPGYDPGCTDNVDVCGPYSIVQASMTYQNPPKRYCVCSGRGCRPACRWVTSTTSVNGGSTVTMGQASRNDLDAFVFNPTLIGPWVFDVTPLPRPMQVTVTALPEGGAVDIQGIDAANNSVTLVPDANGMVDFTPYVKAVFTVSSTGVSVPLGYGMPYFSATVK
jgi:hypothetical protein